MINLGDFKGSAKRLDDVDLPRIGHTIGVGEDELHAFLDTEASGRAFDDHGRPRILFEPHVFYRNLKGAAREKAVAAGLAAKSWGAIPYGKESNQYPRLLAAMKIDRDAALMAASWGSTQVLGENFKMIGYPSVEAMVADFMDDEENHVEGAVRFIVESGIDDEMRRLAGLTRPTRPEDTIGIVSVYNGPGYRKNNYHVKFANFHNKWRGIPDTPWEPDVNVGEPGVEPGNEVNPRPPRPQVEVRDTAGEAPRPTPVEVPSDIKVPVEHGIWWKLFAAIFGWKQDFVTIKNPGSAPGVANFASAVGAEGQPLFGTIIAGAAAKAAIDVVGRVTERVLKRPDVPVSDRKAEDVAGEIAVKAAPQVIEAMKQNPSVARAINGEPLLKSGFFWLGVGGVLTAAGGVVTLYFNGQPDDFETYMAVISPGILALGTMFRRVSLQT